VQSDSPPEAGATPDNRSITDLWRHAGALGDAFQADRSRADIGRPYIETLHELRGRLAAIADQRNQATIRVHAQVEHPHLAWDEQAAVFTTGRFEGRAR
jgi:hypothetical protein